jgi:hypothetical protein
MHPYGCPPHDGVGRAGREEESARRVVTGSEVGSVGRHRGLECTTPSPESRVSV